MKNDRTTIWIAAFNANDASELHSVSTRDLILFVYWFYHALFCNSLQMCALRYLSLFQFGIWRSSAAGLKFPKQSNVCFNRTVVFYFHQEDNHRFQDQTVRKRFEKCLYLWGIFEFDGPWKWLSCMLLSGWCWGCLEIRRTISHPFEYNTFRNGSVNSLFRSGDSVT